MRIRCPTHTVKTSHKPGGERCRLRTSGHSSERTEQAIVMSCEYYVTKLFACNRKCGNARNQPRYNPPAAQQTEADEP